MDIREVQKGLEHILETINRAEPAILEFTSQVHQQYKLSAENLFRYLILRSFDLRPYHDPLSDIGVSSLRTSEGYVLANLRNVVRILRGESPLKPGNLDALGYEKSIALLKAHANTLFRQTTPLHHTRIMVTMPSEAAEDIKLIKHLAENGMEIARINLGHDEPSTWRKMVDNIKKVEEETGNAIKIYMDLGGPKIRVGSIKVKGKMKEKLRLKPGDRILLVRNNEHWHHEPMPTVEVTLPQIIDALHQGHSVFFDDGMIKSEVVEILPHGAELEITECYKSKLKSQKGINLPRTTLELPALTEGDLKVIPFVCVHADIVGYSFVRNGQDVEELYSQLCQNENLGVVFKIENIEAFNKLPEILITGMKRNNIGVMIARGDLAVELGFERTSEVQEEILWLCQAAHIPVIWATQVLENLANTGIPTRAEISDAAHGAHAECVMLNKGPHIDKAVEVLRDILTRMQGHGFKNKNELRPLGVAKTFISENPVKQAH